MMTNLFSIFDPSSSMMNLPLNWTSTMMAMLFLTLSYHMSPSRHSTAMMTLINKLTQEITMLLNPKNKPLVIFLLTIFTFVMMNNTLGLFPFIFTPTSHLMLTMTLALPLWLGYFLYGWTSNMNKMLAHMLPQGTPPLLMPFMVLVESLSNIIRPFTLAIRLSANMIAGHLLLTLMSSAISILAPTPAIMIILTQVLLMMLEMAVALIQSYVFMTLCTLYIKEI